VYACVVLYTTTIGLYLVNRPCTLRTIFCGANIKPRPHQQQCRSNIVEFHKVECCFDIVAVFGNNVERGFREISSFRQSRNKLNMFNFVSTLSKGRNFVRHCGENRQQYRKNVRLCQSNIRLCSIRQC